MPWLRRLPSMPVGTGSIGSGSGTRLEALESRRLGHGDLLSVTELAALAHLPTDVVVAGLARAGAKSVAPPPAVAQNSRGDNPNEAKVLGTAMTGGAGRSPWLFPMPGTTSM